MAGIGVHDDWNRCSPSVGIGVHIRPANAPDPSRAVAWDADTKLIASWLIGSRDGGSPYEFMQDVASRLRNRMQLTTDGHKPYLAAV
jgi:hypothetical protein